MMTEQYNIRDFFPEDDVENRLEVEKFMSELPLREKQIFYLYYLCEHSQEEIAEIVGLNQSQISRILEKMHKNGLPIEGINRGI